MPPLILIPRHTEALEIRQIGDRIQVIFPRPTLHTDGSPVQKLKAIRIYRFDAERSQATRPPDAAAYRRQAQVIATLESTDIESRCFGPECCFIDDPKVQAVDTLFQRTFTYAVEFLNKKGQSDGLSNLAGASPVAIPAAPATIRPLVLPDGIVLEWDAPRNNSDGSQPARIAGYNVYRSLEAPPRFERPLNATPIESPRFQDRDFQFGRNASYAVSVVGSSANPWAESTLSPGILVAPRDTFPPATPRRLEAFGVANTVALRWDANQEEDLAGYFIYRSENEADRGAPLHDKPILETGFVDRAVERQKTYYYRLTAMDRLGNESQPTPPVAASPSVP